ncbi:T. brucei spp.-specific protein [Trypanosoma brucei gambiense DAL972]|uniref:T. brucei spp.-specific protein n=1 Tax=Trypanosoma brucei gambiense (strain MHOM/CI/86/DAL972) TaxID=679716 RepID=C9ZM23_TRYB9|nr:T. brucei spp.-specific protein [Trypanosoma brucei gambiense DAL972]CBH10448.1 T. brucei spp.-specific protein [Trypanosoma brucei gambiense DAL972]|eukprot:XP_011772738.1 T. brucei spp.-specific protein [Trypanosoma brucei gambiense DAL972]
MCACAPIYIYIYMYICMFFFSFRLGDYLPCCSRRFFFVFNFPDSGFFLFVLRNRSSAPNGRFTYNVVRKYRTDLLKSFLIFLFLLRIVFCQHVTLFPPPFILPCLWCIKICVLRLFFLLSNFVAWVTAPSYGLTLLLLLVLVPFILTVRTPFFF